MKRKKRPLTLLEIMIVIFLIGLIGSVVGYSMRGSLEEGKAFRTEQAIKKVEDILLLEIAKGEDIEKVVANPARYLEKSGITKDTAQLLKDGWGQPFQISQSKGDLKIYSKKWDQHKKAKKKLVDPDNTADDEDHED